VAEANNRSLFVLTIVTVLALPINIMTGMFGMNVGGIPLAEHPWGFWLVVSLITLITLVAGWIAFNNTRNK
jgi:zinc transporter